MPPRQGLQQARGARRAGAICKEFGLARKAGGRIAGYVSAFGTASPRMGEFVTRTSSRSIGRKAPVVHSRTSGARCLLRLALGGFGLFWVGALLMLLAQ